ncbi:MAG: hypothetical protein AAF621_04460 [Pseudomonadota bacterium]
MENSIIKIILDYGLTAVPFGYIAMGIARSGVARHNTQNRFFITLLFATIIYYTNITLAGYIPTFPVITQLLAIILSLTVALIWRLWGEKKLFSIKQKLGLSYENHKGNTFHTIFANGDNLINSITVYTNDERIFQCYSIGEMLEKYDRGIIIDETGIMLPVTHFKGKNDTCLQDVTNDIDYGWEGINCTYIPQREIKRYEFTLQKRPFLGKYAC